MVISGLTKYFSNHKAVDDLCLSIPEGECFGLLGLYSINSIYLSIPEGECFGLLDLYSIDSIYLYIVTLRHFYYKLQVLMEQVRQLHLEC